MGSVIAARPAPRLLERLPTLRSLGPELEIPSDETYRPLQDHGPTVFLDILVDGRMARTTFCTITPWNRT